MRQSVSITSAFTLVALITVVGFMVSNLSSYITSSSMLSRLTRTPTCATVETMGEPFGNNVGSAWKESLRVRKLIHHHFQLNGASVVRHLLPDQFCQHGFVIAKATEGGFGNEMYKILTAAALSIMLNRSLIIGQISGRYPFGGYIAYSNVSFTLDEVKYLWKQNDCIAKYDSDLVIRADDFLKPRRTNILCSNWKEWEQPIIWLQSTTDAMAAQFFLKNIHPEMRAAAIELFGDPKLLSNRPNVFGELMRALISPSTSVEAAVQSVVANNEAPDITLHMRTRSSRSVKAAEAALSCIRKVLQKLHLWSRLKVVLVSDNADFISDIKPSVAEMAKVLQFEYLNFRGDISLEVSKLPILKSKFKDWGSAPRWVSFVDFFLASRAKHAVISGADRRVGTTFAQLIAALAAARNLDDSADISPNFTFLSSIQNNLLREGLSNQIGWGHAWNRFAGSLSCQGQANQCANTPLLPPAWWEGMWQSPIARDIRRLKAYGVRLSSSGTIDEEHLHSFCRSRKPTLLEVPV